MSNIYISYSEADSKFVRDLTTRLERRGYRVRSQKDIAGEAMWAESIVYEIDNCEAFILVLSRHTSGSHFMPRELRMAEARGKPIVAIAKDGTPVPEEMAYALARLRPIAFHETSFGQAYGLLLDALARAGYPAKRAGLGRGAKIALFSLGGLAVVVAVALIIILGPGSSSYPDADPWIPTSTALLQRAAPVEAPASTSPPSTAMTILAVKNEWLEDICFVYISPVESDAWGEDWLKPNQTIPPGSEAVFEVPVGVYDLRAETCNEDYTERMEVSLTEPKVWTLY